MQISSENRLTKMGFSPGKARIDQEENTPEKLSTLSNMNVHMPKAAAPNTRKDGEYVRDTRFPPLIEREPRRSSRTSG